MCLQAGTRLRLRKEPEESVPMAWVTILFCNFCTAILSIILAKKKHRPALMWFLVTLPFGVIALFVLLALPAIEEESG